MPRGGYSVCGDGMVTVIGSILRYWRSSGEHSFKTRVNRLASAFRWRLQKSQIVRKSGASSPTVLMKSTRSREAFAIRLDE